MPLGPFGNTKKNLVAAKNIERLPPQCVHSFSLFHSFSLSPSENTYISASRGPRDKVKKGKVIRNQPQGNFSWAVTPSPTFQPPCVHARTPTQRAWAVAQAPDIGIQNFKQISFILA